MHESTCTTHCCCIYHSLSVWLFLSILSSYVVYFVYRTKTLPSHTAFLFLSLNFHFHPIAWRSLSFAYPISHEKHRTLTRLTCSPLQEEETRRFTSDESVWQGQEQPTVSRILAILLDQTSANFCYRIYHLEPREGN